MGIISWFKKKKFNIPLGGCIPSIPDKRDVLMSEMYPLPIRIAPVFPPPFDLTILNQGNLPHCVGYSGASLKQEKELRERISKIFNGDWLYLKCKEIDNYIGNGTYLRVLMKVLQKQGAKPEEGLEEEAIKYRIGGYARVDDLSFEGLKKAIYVNGVIIAGFTGSNAGWQSAYIRPPKLGERTWGHAVCVHPETKILTQKGYKLIKDIKIGEYVLSHKNKWKRVNKISKRLFQGLLNLISVHNQINPLLITDEHPIYINKATKWIKFKQKGKQRKFEFDWMNASEVKKYDFALNPIPQYYPIPFDKDIAYLLGLYVADGNLKRGTLNPFAFKAIRFSLNREVNNKVQEKLISIWKEKYNLLPHFYYSKQGKDVQVIFYNARLAKWFSELGGMPKQKNIDFDLILGLSPEILEHILEGWTDGDGYYFENGRRMIFTASETLAYQLQLILQRCGYSYGIQNISNRGWNIEFQKIKKHSKTHYLENNEIKKIKENNKAFYEGEVWNLEVEEDNSYIAEGIAIHNCLIGYNQDYIIGQNSWGLDWGNKGLFYVPKNYSPFESWAVLSEYPTYSDGWVASEFLRSLTFQEGAEVKPICGLNLRDAPMGNKIRVLIPSQKLKIIKIGEIVQGYKWVKVQILEES